MWTLRPQLPLVQILRWKEWSVITTKGLPTVRTFCFPSPNPNKRFWRWGSGFLCFWDPRVARSCGRALSCPRRDRFPARSAAGLGSALLPHSFTKDNTTEIDRCFPAKVRRHTQTTTTRAATRQKQQQKDKEGNKRKRPFACCARSLLCSGSGTRRNKKRQSVLPSLLLSRDFEAGPSHLPSSSGRVSQLRGTMEDEPHEEAANDVVRCCYWDASRG